MENRDRNNPAAGLLSRGMLLQIQQRGNPSRSPLKVPSGPVPEQASPALQVHQREARLKAEVLLDLRHSNTETDIPKAALTQSVWVKPLIFQYMHT